MPNAPLVRLIDDDTDLLAAQTQALKIAGFVPEPFDCPLKALDGLTADYPGVILSDVRMPQIDGFELFRRVHALDPDLPVILLTGHGDVAMAVAALKAGAYDFLTKPVGLDDLSAALRRASAARALVMENRVLRALRHVPPAENEPLPGTSAVMEHLRRTVARVAEAGVDALITGPSGVGKEAVARAVHRQSDRRARSFVHLSCGALDTAQFETEVLGNDVFGDARQARRAGRLERAHRGTLFLDDIDLLPLPLQARLLPVIETGEIWHNGASAPRQVDLRILAATRADLSSLVTLGAFRSDLFFRLSGVVLNVPPLAARPEDVTPIFRTFLIAACQRQDLAVPALTGLTRVRLGAHSWPGNLRELKHFAESTALGLTPFDIPQPDGDAPGLTDMVAGYEAELIREALRLSGGSASAALARLRLPRKTFYDKLTRHGIRPSDYRG